MLTHTCTVQTSDSASAISKLYSRFQACSLLGCSSPPVPAEWPPTQHWQVRDGPSRHPCSAPVSCQHHRRHCREHSASRIKAQVVWRDHWFQPAVWLSCEKRCNSLQLPHSRSSFLSYTPNWPFALFLMLLHPPETLYLLNSTVRKHSHFQTPLKTHLFKPT